MRRLVAALVLGTLAVWGAAPAAAQPLTVAAAASLQLAFRDVKSAYEEGHDAQVTLVFSASGNLARQIQGGAPYDLFASADESWVEWLRKRNLIEPDTMAVYAEGVLALAVHDPARLAGLPAELDAAALGRLRDPAFRAIAIANPEYAPYGVAAVAALRGADLMAALGPRLVYGDNVRQALTYVETGNADAGLVAASLLPHDRHDWRPLDPALYPPLRQAMAIVRGAARREAAGRFAAFLLGPRGRAILAHYGLRPPPHPGG